MAEAVGTDDGMEVRQPGGIRDSFQDISARNLGHCQCRYAFPQVVVVPVTLTSVLEDISPPVYFIKHILRINQLSTGRRGSEGELRIASSQMTISCCIVSLPLSASTGPLVTSLDLTKIW